VPSRGLSIEVDGLTETLKAVNSLERELARPAANKELRGAAKSCATVLAGELVRAAASSGVPVAPRVASSIRVKSDRLPVVSIGGPKKVGSGARGSAAALVWGSEQGPKSDPNHWGVGPNPAGYWIAPTVDRFQSSRAIETYRRAVFEVLHEAGLV
jgi:hypothetical protein